jgi:hypothetical protein
MILSIRQRRKIRKRNKYLTAPLGWLSAEPVRSAYPLVKVAADWAVERVLGVHAPWVPIPKEFALDLRSIHRPWSAVLALRIRLKW